MLYSGNVLVHVIAGAIGLLVGLAPLLSKKGGATHRRWGRYFVIFAAINIGSAVFGIMVGAPPSALVAATLSGAYQFIGSLRALAMTRRRPATLDHLLALSALVAAGIILATVGPGTASWSPAIGYSTLGYVAAVALYDLSRMFWGTRWARSVWPLDHGLKMTGAYFAMASAGAGNLLRGLQPWSQVLPSALGMAVMLVFAIQWRRHLRCTADLVAR